MRVVAVSLAVAGTLGLAACAVQPPEGPAVAAMPGPGKTYEQFQADNARCQEEAAKAAGPLTPAQGATESGVGSAAAGTVLGAGAGALIGAAAGRPAPGRRSARASDCCAAPPQAPVLRNSRPPRRNAGMTSPISSA